MHACNVFIRMHDIVYTIRSGICSKSLSDSQVIPWPQDPLLRHRPLPLLCNDRVWPVWIPHGRLLLQGSYPCTCTYVFICNLYTHQWFHRAIDFDHLLLKLIVIIVWMHTPSTAFHILTSCRRKRVLRTIMWPVFSLFHLTRGVAMESYW